MRSRGVSLVSARFRAIVKIQLPAGQATPAPPVGTALGPHGVNIMDFTRAYNEKTQGQVGQVIPVEITILEDRSFTFITKTPPAGDLLKKAAGFEVRTSPWITFFGLSAVAYAVSFIFYSQILKYFALNKIYPAMTIAQIVVITLLGFLMGEAVGARHALGLVFGAVAIYLILA